MREIGLINQIKSVFSSSSSKSSNSEDNIILENPYVSEAWLLTLYDEFVVSDTFKWFKIGERYYKGENDILYRQMIKYVNGKQVIDNSQPNNTLNHCFAKCLVDQKVNYSFGKAPKLNCDDENYLEEVKEILKNNNFDYALGRLGTMASNRGIAWLQAYINPEGKLKFMMVPADQVIPIWSDDLHTSLNAIIRVYLSNETQGLDPNQNTIIEYWTSTGWAKYVINGNTLTPMTNLNMLNVVDGKYTGEMAHYKQGDWLKTWNKVPFIPFKNNIDEFPDVRYIKNLIDNYDLTRSDLGNALEQLRNFIILLENAQGTEPEEFLENLKLYGIIKTENIDGSGSSAKILSNPIDCQASVQHTQLIKENIIELLQGVNLNLDFKAPPSGVALQLLYSGLDIKANGFETEFKQGFKEMLYFINQYLTEQGKAPSSKDDITIEFQRDTPQNTAEQIQNIKNSKGMVSDKTLYKHHPFVDNADEEEKQVHKERKSFEEPHFDQIPLH